VSRRITIILLALTTLLSQGHAQDDPGSVTATVSIGNGWWQVVPIWEPDPPLNPLRRYEPAEPR
jgi:hypothetical protein